MHPDLIKHISAGTNLPGWKIKPTVALLSEGATIPFIARYRKEATGSLDEVNISAIQKEYSRLSDLIKRKEAILKTIGDQGKLTDTLQQAIHNCWTSTELEDIYLPYKPKRQTRATKAKDSGLEPLAKIIMSQQSMDPHSVAGRYKCEGYPDNDSVIQGAQDIIAEWVAESRAARDAVRELFARNAHIQSKLIKGKESIGRKYEDYFKFNEPLKRCPSHRLLAIRRGENEGVLRVSIQPDKEFALERLYRIFIKSNNANSTIVRSAVEDSYKRLLSSSIETEFKNSSKEKADKEAISVFTKNLRQLLLTAPLRNKRILGIDPGFRSGCKVVCLDELGNLEHYKSIFPHPPQRKATESAKDIEWMIGNFEIQAIAIGNGTAGRETEQWLKSVVSPEINLYLISEDGASIYSASEVARDEFPELDLTIRGAISIGRRLLDPLAELVKIDAKSIGVGQYQHDVDQKLLQESLDEVVASCVNTVGVNLNTASVQLLTHVSGLTRATAENIVTHREANGPFKARMHLKKVKGIGAKAFEQSAGFLRIPGATNPLDNSAVHPERYALVDLMAENLRMKAGALIGNNSIAKAINLDLYKSDNVGLPTLKDIVEELKKPGLDPRGEAVSFSFSDQVRTIDDLRSGMKLPGKITNVTKFGAFVDIGIKENGLVHISQMANRYISDPSEVVALNQVVEVTVVDIDKIRGRVGLSMI